MVENALDSILERTETEKPAKYAELKEVKDKIMQNLTQTPFKTLTKLAKALLIYLDLNSLDDLFTEEMREKANKSFSFFLQMARFDVEILHLHLFESHLATLEGLKTKKEEVEEVFGFCLEAVQASFGLKLFSYTQKFIQIAEQRATSD